jgi:hypothetical protein
MRRLVLHAAVIVAILAVAGIGSYAIAGGDQAQSFEADRLTGFEENPDISTPGKGRFEAEVDRQDRTIDYKLSYSRLEGDVLQAHIHFGKEAVNGGISAFLCSNLPSPPAGTPACPPSGTVAGTIEPADIIGPAEQGLEPMSFGALVKAMKAESTYVNVHSSEWPGGEIRAQIEDDDHDGNGDDD